MAALIVGDRGQIIPYSRIKRWGFFLVFSLVTSLFAVSGIGFLMLNKQMEISRLEENVDALEKRSAELKRENELLMAKLVIAEAQLRPADKKEPTQKAAAENTKGEAPEAASGKRSEEQPPAAAEPAEGEAPAPETAEPQPETPSVTVEGVEVTYDADRNLIQARYTIRNTSAGRAPVSGRTVMVLQRREEGGAGRWIALPDVSVSRGEPNGKAGAPFKINNFKPFSLKTNGPAAAFALDGGTVFVFDRKGELIFKKAFPVAVSYQPPPKQDPPPQAAPRSTAPNATENPSNPVTPPSSMENRQVESKMEMMQEAEPEPDADAVDNTGSDAQLPTGDASTPTGTGGGGGTEAGGVVDGGIEGGADNDQGIQIQ